MAKIRQVLHASDSSSEDTIPKLVESVAFRSLHNFSRVASPTLLGSNTQCGSALATEIDSYRRRVQTLLHFFDCIAQYWWDHLHVYKRELIKRPSKSADEVRSFRSRLVARLNKFTMRTVLPAAAAIATMEAHASVKVLPSNFLAPVDLFHTEFTPVVENSDALLRKACSLARRLGDIEKLKQRLVLAALTWITSDGRDFRLRAQRVVMLARHVEPCLIEHFTGVRALLTHYYRPRVLLSQKGDKQSYLRPYIARMEPITAARLTTTNEQIMDAIEHIIPRIQRYVSFTSNKSIGDLSMPFGLMNWQDSAQKPSSMDELVSNWPDSSLPVPKLMPSAASHIPMLPSIVLNPLSVDTSQIDWLSYEINQRNLNLHILNTEEPEGLAHMPSSDRPISQTDTDYLSSVQTFSPKHPLSRDETLDQLHIAERLWSSETPIANPHSKAPSLSDSSQESEFSDLYDSRPNSPHPLYDPIKPIEFRSSDLLLGMRSPVSSLFRPLGGGISINDSRPTPRFDGTSSSLILSRLSISESGTGHQGEGPRSQKIKTPIKQTSRSRQKFTSNKDYKHGKRIPTWN